MIELRLAGKLQINGYIVEDRNSSHQIFLKSPTDINLSFSDSGKRLLLLYNQVLTPEEDNLQ